MRLFIPALLAARAFGPSLAMGACGASPQTYYVDSRLPALCSGNYSTANRSCSGSDGSAYRTIDQAAHQAAGGDTILIREGSYQETIRAWNSGAPGCPITFKRYGEEQVMVDDAPGLRNLPAGEDPDVEWSDFCIYIYGKTNIEIDGIECRNTSRWARIVNSRDIVIRNSSFSGATCPGSQGGINLFNSSFCSLKGNVLEEGNDNIYLAHSDNNLIEGNTIRSGRHTLWAIKCGNRNVVRGNYFHNPIQKIGEIYDCQDDPPDAYDASKFNLVEHNTFAFTPPAGPEGPFNGIQLAGQKCVIRNTLFYENTGGGLALTLYEDEARYTTDNRIYNNVFYKNHFGGLSISTYNGFSLSGNVLKNNIFLRNDFVDYDRRFHSWGVLSGKPVQVLTSRQNGYLMERNVLFNEQAGEDYLISQTHYDDDWEAQPIHHTLAWWQGGFPNLWSSNLELAPEFKDPENHDFHLLSASPLIDQGAFLTKAVNGGSGTSLFVEDSLYFYAGNGIAGERGDAIQFESQLESARITSINHSTGELTLDRALQWQAGEGIALAYSGSAPDPGAFEYGTSCSDGIQNGDEAGIDCGGSCLNPCIPPTDASSCREEQTAGIGKKIQKSVRRIMKRHAVLSRHAIAGQAQRMKRLTQLLAKWPNHAQFCSRLIFCESVPARQIFRETEAQVRRLKKVALRSSASSSLRRGWHSVLNLLRPVSGYYCG